jgi:hypothetical protein
VPSLLRALVPYSRKTVIKYQKPGRCIENALLKLPARYLYPKGIMKNCDSAAIEENISFPYGQSPALNEKLAKESITGYPIANPYHGFSRGGTYYG